MNKIVYDLLLKLEQCDDRHNRCDYLMEHDEITYLLEHIEEKNKQLDKYKNVIDKIKEYIKTRKEEYNNETELSRACINGWHYCNLMNNILELLEEVE